MLTPSIAGALSCILLMALFNLYYRQTELEQLSNSDGDYYTAVYVPLGTFDREPYKQFEPQYVRVVLYDDFACCGTIRWVNEDILPVKLVAVNDSDPKFYEATRNLHIQPGNSFEFVFTKPGEYGFHGGSGQFGKIEVLPCNCD